MRGGVRGPEDTLCGDARSGVWGDLQDALTLSVLLSHTTLLTHCRVSSGACVGLDGHFWRDARATSLLSSSVSIGVQLSPEAEEAPGETIESA